MKLRHKALIVIACFAVCFTCGVVFGFYYAKSLVKLVHTGMGVNI